MFVLQVNLLNADRKEKKLGIDSGYETITLFFIQILYLPLAMTELYR